MPNDHWFDTLNRMVTEEASRRGALGAAFTLVAGLIPGAARVSEAASKRKPKRHKKRKKKSPPAPQSCSGGVCAAVAEWAGDQGQINHCEFICRQCDEDEPRDFCIVDRGDKVAECCDIEETCCGDRCCGSYCCDLGAGRGSRCVVDAMVCCPDDFASGVCDRGTQKCCSGFGCIGRSEDCPDDDCDERCAELGLECCHGACFDTRVDHDHCGGCDRPCTGAGERCCGGICVDARFSNTHCGICNRSCLCCHGACIDSQIWQCCRDHPPHQALCEVHGVCCTTNDGSPGCCF